MLKFPKDIVVSILNHVGYNDILSCIQARILEDNTELWRDLIQRKYSISLEEPVSLEDIRILEEIYSQHIYTLIPKENIIQEVDNIISKHLERTENTSQLELSLFKYPRNGGRHKDIYLHARTLEGALLLLSKYRNIYKCLWNNPNGLDLNLIIIARRDYRCAEIIKSLVNRITRGAGVGTVPESCECAISLMDHYKKGGMIDQEERLVNDVVKYTSDMLWIERVDDVN